MVDEGVILSNRFMLCQHSVSPGSSTNPLHHHSLIILSANPNRFDTSLIILLSAALPPCQPSASGSSPSPPP